MSEEKKVFHLDDIIENKPEETVVEETPVETTEEVKEEPVVVDTAIPNPEKEKRVLVTPKTSSMNLQTAEDGTVKGKEIGELKELPKPGLSPDKAFEKEQLELIDKNIARVKEELMEEHIKPFKQKCMEIKMEKEANGEIAPDVVSENLEIEGEESTSDNKPNGAVRSTQTVELNDMSHFQEDLDNAPNIDIDDDIFKEYDDDDKGDTDDDLDEESLSPEEREKEKKEFNERAKLIESSIRSEDDQIDISSFAVSNRPISINKAIEYVNSDVTAGSSSVPLYNTGRLITFTPLSGAEIVALSPKRGESDLTILRRQFQTIYKHDVSEYKPNLFTNWLRSIDAGDLGQLYFGLYKATFEDANYISYQCDKCNTFFMVKQPMSSMCRLSKETEEAQKQRIHNIEEHGSVDDDIKSREELYVISPNYAVVIKPKSLYNLMEPNYLDDQFKESLSSIINLMGYIGAMYYIDKSNKTLKPIDVKADATSIAKTFRYKCLAFAKLITSITPDEYAMLQAKLTNVAMKESEAGSIFEYIIPAAECQGEFKEGESKGLKCTNKIPEEKTQAISLLFTRHQLAVESTLRID